MYKSAYVNVNLYVNVCVNAFVNVHAIVYVNVYLNVHAIVYVNVYVNVYVYARGVKTADVVVYIL